jgi:CubicO group peptidase (beta-lactamase class C family)
VNRRDFILGSACYVAVANYAHAQPAELVGDWSGTLPETGQTIRFQISEQGRIRIFAPNAVYRGTARSLRPNDIQLEWKTIKMRFTGAMVSPDRLEGRFERGVGPRNYPLALARGSTPAPPLDGPITGMPTTQADFEALGARARLEAFAAVAQPSGMEPRYWLMSNGRKAVVAPSTLWQLASVTKSMTATLIARLVEMDVVGWDDTVGALLGERVPTMREHYRAATFRHLLSHRSGLPRDLPKPDPALSRIEHVRRALAQNPIGEMATKVAAYSNDGYVVAAAMLEARTGETWEELMRKHVFLPLGMKTAGFGLPPADQLTGRASLTARVVRAVNGAPGASINPAGGVHASLSELLVFLAAHRDRSDLLKADSWDVLHNDPYGESYAMGWTVRSGGVLQHNGITPFWSAYARVDRRTGVIAAAATNEGGSDAVDAVELAARGLSTSLTG